MTGGQPRRAFGWRGKSMIVAQMTGRPRVNPLPLGIKKGVGAERIGGVEGGVGAVALTRIQFETRSFGGTSAQVDAAHNSTCWARWGPLATRGKKDGVERKLKKEGKR